jgi:hypothetical protein
LFCCGGALSFLVSIICPNCFVKSAPVGKSLRWLFVSTLT